MSPHGLAFGGTVPFAFVLGFLLGMRHATDADHIVAIGTMLRRSNGVGGAMATGALWGLGHSLTVLGIGVAMVLFGVVVPEGTAQAMEIAVAAMLIALGVANLRRARDSSPRSAMRPFIVGVIHGLAGSAGLTLVALTTIRDRSLSLAYLALFGVGTVVGMMLVTGTLALPIRYAARKSERVEAWLVRGASTPSVALGAWLAVRVLAGMSD